MPRPVAELPRGTAPASLSDEGIVERVLAGETALFEVLMRRYNPRLYRLALAVLGRDGEAEDVLQETYLRAYQHLSRFEGRARFSTWLTRIALHEALARQRRSDRFTSLEATDGVARLDALRENTSGSPEALASSGELRGLLERTLQQMPEPLRLVFSLRALDGLDTEETADCLGISTANVKVRLHRARSLLRSRIDEKLGVELRQLYPFAGQRCDQIVRGVMQRLDAANPQHQGD